MADVEDKELINGLRRPAILVLEDGSIFRGTAIGADGKSVGEVVFNTALTGYQEILTDPSYAQQIVTLTYPHIGNTGSNAEDAECQKVWAAGLVIRDLPLLSSSFRNQQSLDDYLKERNILGIADIDTRRLTRILRDKGAQNGCIMAGEIDEDAALAAAKAFPGLKGADLAKEVTTDKVYSWDAGTWSLGEGFKGPKDGDRFKVVAYDYGTKSNILRMLVDRGCDLTVVPMALLCLLAAPLPLHWRYRITVCWPRMVIWGAKDPYIPLKQAELQRRHCHPMPGHRDQERGNGPPRRPSQSSDS